MMELPENKKPLVFAAAAVFLLTAVFFIRARRSRKEIPPQPKAIIYGDTLAPGENLITVFAKRGVPANNYYGVIGEFSKIYNVKKIQAGHYYEIAMSTENKILEFSYQPEVAKKYLVKLTTAGYRSDEVQMRIHKKYFGYSGTVQNNLYYSMISAGVNPSLIMNFADIFESRIDFLTDPRPGDRFFIIYEQSFTDSGQEVDNGTILAGKYIMCGGRRARRKISEFIAFALPRGELYDYYSPSGESLSTQFLKAPLHFRRISSYFSNRRFHPILKYYRSHYGIDYAAPSGTPVSSIGDGKVVYVGRNGGYGRMVKIKHNSTYESWYGHLSRYSGGIKRGAFVKKGQDIGYVGSTGLSTGPHLDFRVKKHGSFVNFLTLKLPPAKSLTKKEMEDFLPLKKKYYRYIAELIMQGKFKHENTLN
ncbi:MAG: peptidase M23 [Elusimicrobia bacterium HGW-Elusimicrobia-2]|nr:MAG: peptidase M23 [Elusimicrobia bacterium HGW-Elusimicrobia-2]